MKYLWLLPLLLFGCADSSTKGNMTERTYDQQITVQNNSAAVSINFPVYATVESASEVAQETQGTSTINPATDINLADKASMIAAKAAEIQDAATDFNASLTDSQNDNRVNNSTSSDPAKPTDKIEPKPDPVKPVDPTLNLSGVSWLHTDVSGWEQTGTLKSVLVNSSTITLDYDKANVWPGVSADGTILNANPWIFVKQDGKWYAATFEWLRPGQTSKDIKSVNGDHIKQSPLKDFVPKNGEVYGFMVSGLARASERNVQERTNIVMYEWGKGEVKQDDPIVDSNTPTDMFGYTNFLINSIPDTNLSYNSVMQRRHTFSGVGPDYGKNLLIQWESGKTLKVPDTAHMVMYGEPGFRKYQPGGKYSHNNKDIPTMEVYAARGDWEKSVTIFFNKP